MAFSNFAGFCDHLQLDPDVVAQVKPAILARAVNLLTNNFGTNVAIRDEHNRLYKAVKAPFFKGLWWPWPKKATTMTLEAFAREFDLSVEGLIQETTEWMFIKGLSTRELPLDTRASLVKRFKTLVRVSACKFFILMMHTSIA